MLESKRIEAMQWVTKLKKDGVKSLDLALYELIIPEMNEVELEEFLMEVAKL